MESRNHAGCEDGLHTTAHRFSTPLTTISTCRRPHLEQTNFSRQSSSHLGGIGLHLMAATLAPHD